MRATFSGELDDAIADRRQVLLAWLESADVPGYLRDAGVDADRLRGLGGVLTG